MTDTHRQSSLPLLGALLAAGLMAAAFILGIQFKNFRQPGTITVKGLAEKNFQSDSATWRSGASLHGESYQDVLDALESERKKLEDFLREQGFEESEMQIGLPSVERVYQEIRNSDGEVVERKPNGYDGSLSITVNTKKLDKIQAAQTAIRNLRAKNEFIGFDNPQYLLGNLETIKRDLITQATEDAQKRAAEFAKTGGGKVGAMRSASQGSFNIYSDSGSSSDDDYGGTYDKSTVGKQVRLVVTIEYAID
ncbi:SIMPL domain-containing protein [Neisseria sp. 23W00296]|uniref:SIMPL domain-containing protein n=1 Tax=unclassified Neisseria TaxID=2623750 RepID=UPI00375656E2